MPTFEKRKASTPDVLRFAKRTKRRACEAHEIKHESDVADDSSDVDAAPQNPRSVGSKPSTPGSSKPDPTSGGLLQEESDDDECQVIEHRQQPAQAQEAVRIRKCLNLFKAFPNAAGITMEELLKCWIRYALTESGDKILDCSTWLHSQSTVLEEDAFIFDRLFKLSPPAVMLQTICDKLVKCLHSAELRSGGAQATALPSQAFEPATVFAEASATRDANAAFDPVRYRSLDKSERVQMVKVHFPSAQKLFQYHATINNAISIKLASHDVQSPAHLFHETWSRLGADSKSEWEQLLFRLHKDGLKKPVGPAGQQLLEQQRAIAIVAAAIAGRSSPSPGANFSEAFTVHLDSHNAATRKGNHSENVSSALDCVWSFNDAGFPHLSKDERSIAAKTHFPTSLHPLAYHIRMHEAMSCLVNWQDSCQAIHRLRRVWQALPCRIQKAWELHLSHLHEAGAKNAFSKKAQKALKLHKIKSILIRSLSSGQSGLNCDESCTDAGPLITDRAVDVGCEASRCATKLHNATRTFQRNPIVPRPDTNNKQIAAVFVDFVACTRKPGFCYVLILVNTPQVPIADVTAAEIEESCRAAYRDQASVVEIFPLSSQAWAVCLRANCTDVVDYKSQMIGRHMTLRGFKAITTYLPSCPASVFSADISRHPGLDATQILLQLRRDLSRRGLPPPTLMEQRNGTRRRLLVYFPRPPNLFVFIVPVMVPGLTIPYNAFFRGFDQNASCWICHITHGDQICPLAMAVTAA